VTNAAGAGGITGTIAFDVTAADESDLPDDGEKNYVGSVDQLDGSDITATFAADDGGIANKESDVSVGFVHLRNVTVPDPPDVLLPTYYYVPDDRTVRPDRTRPYPYRYPTRTRTRNPVPGTP